MRESERKMEKITPAGKLNVLAPILLIDGLILQSLIETYILLRVKEITKSMKQQKYNEGNFGTKPQNIIKKWSTQQNRAGCENLAACEILQL